MAAASGLCAAPNFMASKVLAAAIRSRYGTPSKALMSAAPARLGNESPITRSNSITRDTVLSPRSIPRADWRFAPYPKPQLTIAVGEILTVRHWWPLSTLLGHGPADFRAAAALDPFVWSGRVRVSRTHASVRLKEAIVSADNTPARTAAKYPLKHRPFWTTYMIIQTAPAGTPRLAVMMHEHTALCGQFARAFGNDQFESPSPLDLMIYVIEHHDAGWAEFDREPVTDEKTGLPYNLVETPAEYITVTSRLSPDFNSAAPSLLRPGIEHAQLGPVQRPLRSFHPRVDR